MFEQFHVANQSMPVTDWLTQSDLFADAYRSWMKSNLDL
jgi:hypothetical protein